MTAINRRQFTTAAAVATAGAAMPAAAEAAQELGRMTLDERKAVGNRFRLVFEAMPEHMREPGDFELDCNLTDEQFAAITAGELEPTALQLVNFAAYSGAPVQWLMNTEQRFSNYGSGVDAATHNDIAAQLKHRRESAGMTINQVAAALNVACAYWEDLEAGNYPLDFALGVRACLLFRVDPLTIMRPAEGRPLPKTTA